MKSYRKFLLLAGCTALAACAADGAKKAAEPVQDGKSEATAVVISAADTTQGIAAENDWIRAHMPDCRKSGQQLIQGEQGLYDKILLQCTDGPREVYFEISNFFGKF